MVSRSRAALKGMLGVGLLAAIVQLPGAAFGQGLIMSGAGAANRAMAGASTAAPLDAAGAGYWNPAAISGLPENQVYFGADLLYADTNVTVEAVPPPGSNFSDTGVTPLPTIAMVYQAPGSNVTLGLGVYALAGGAVNFPTPRVGALAAVTNQYAAASCLQIAPVISLQVTDRLAIGGGPTIDVFSLSLDPAFFAADPGGGFLSATHGRPFWGGGFQLGAYYIVNDNWQVGASYKSPQWFEEFEWHSVDAAGTPHEVTLQHRLPEIVSLGFAYRGIERTVVALDIRHFAYGGSAPYGEPVSNGGTGWNSIFAMALGVQREISDRCKVRLGYLYNENPVPDVLTLFNTELPAINKHQLSLGLGIQFNESIAMDLAWIHGFKNYIRGPIPASQIPGGAMIDLDQSFDALSVGMRINF